MADRRTASHSIASPFQNRDWRCYRREFSGRHVSSRLNGRSFSHSVINWLAPVYTVPYASGLRESSSRSRRNVRTGSNTRSRSSCNWLIVCRRSRPSSVSGASSWAPSRACTSVAICACAAASTWLLLNALTERTTTLRLPFTFKWYSCVLQRTRLPISSTVIGSDLSFAWIWSKTLMMAHHSDWRLS